MQCRSRPSYAAPAIAADAHPPLGRYRILRLHGRGGFGEVYVGHDPQLDRQVAIKVPNVHCEPDEIDAFLAEARKLARLRHPGIVAVHDAGHDGGRCWIVSDFLEGINLADWLETQRPWNEVARVVASVADALAYAHAQSTVHRDVKPGNIILLADGQPVLFDFGLALTERESQEPDHRVCGTPYYMSPEQVEGEAHRIDGRTDIWSLGVMMYEALTGRLPFRATSLPQLYVQIKEDEPQPPRQLAHGVPLELERICLKAMAKRAQDRYTTAADLGRDLRQLLRAHGEEMPLRVPSVPPEGRGAPGDAQLRQVTVLAASCEDGASEDPEERAAQIGAFRRVCETTTERFSGTVLPGGGASVMICFGYPSAFEDAAQRAVRTALAIRADAPVACGAIVHTGRALVGDAGDGSGPLGLVGEVRTVVTRLDAVAPAGAVVISETTQRLVQGFFESESLGSAAVKGLVQPIELFRVLRPSRAQSRIEVAGPALTPLVGREQEVGLLLDRWEKANEGMGQVVLLSGEPGIGKSRLVKVVKDHVAGDEVRARSVVEWRCSPYYQHSALYPAIDYFERTLGLDEDETGPARLERLLKHLALYGLDRPDVVSLLAALLSIPCDDRFPPLALSPQRLKERTLEALLGWVREYARRHTLLFVIEDLHWLDASSLELLALIVEQCAEDPMLTLLTFRPEFEPHWKPIVHQSQVSVGRLTKRQVGDMIRKQTGLESVPAGFADQVAARTDGVPLFVEEFTKMVMDSGGMANKDAVTSIPDTLTDLLLARVDRVASTRELIQLGATLGREFSYDMLRAVSPIDEHTLQRELGTLAMAQILYTKGVPPRCSYLFKHALIQDAAYQSITRARRQQLHGTIATVLAEQFASVADARPEWLAHHYTEAGSAAEAVGLWEKAGVRSQQRFAHAEAMAHFEKALSLLAGTPEGSHRDHTELRLQSQLAFTLTTARGWAAPELERLHARSRELCRALGDRSTLFHTMWGTWAWRLLRAELDTAKELSDELLERATWWHDLGCQMEAHWAIGCTSLFRGDFERGDQHFRQADELYDAERSKHHAKFTGQNSGSTLGAHWGWLLWHLGRPDAALAKGREAIERARAVGCPFTQGFAVYHHGCVAQLCRMPGLVRETAEDTLEIAQEQGFAIWRALGTLCLAAAMHLTDRSSEAAAMIRQGLDFFQATGARLSSTHYACLLADTSMRAGRLDDAAQAIDFGLEFANTHGERFAEAELYRLKGELSGSRGDAGAAETFFRRALVVARGQQARGWALRAATSFARLLLKQERRDEARTLLEDAVNGFTEGLDTQDVVDARALLAKL